MNHHSNNPNPASLSGPFTPTPSLPLGETALSEGATASLIADFCDGSLTLHQIAAAHNISLLTLLEFFKRPDIVRRIHEINQAATRRAQLAAERALPCAVRALVNVISHAAADPSDSTAARHAAQAARLLFKLKHQSPPPQPRPTFKATLLPLPALPPTFNPKNN